MHMVQYAQFHDGRESVRMQSYCSGRKDAFSVTDQPHTHTHIYIWCGVCAVLCLRMYACSRACTCVCSIYST